MEVRGIFELQIPNYNGTGREILGYGEMWGECDYGIDIYDIRAIDDIQGVEFEYLEDAETAEDMSGIADEIRDAIVAGYYSNYYNLEMVWLVDESDIDDDYMPEQSLEQQAMEDYYREIAWGL